MDLRRAADEEDEDEAGSLSPRRGSADDEDLCLRMSDFARTSWGGLGDVTVSTDTRDSFFGVSSPRSDGLDSSARLASSPS